MNLMLPPVNQRIKNLIDTFSKGVVLDFSKKLGYKDPQKLNRLFKIDERTKKYPVPSTDMLFDISNMFEISLDFLVKGKEDFTIKNNDGRGVPYYDSDITGSIVGSFSDIKEKPAFYIDFKPFNDCDAYFTIHGDSMFPKYQSGDIVGVKQWNNQNTLLWGESYLVITDATENDMRTVKNIHPNEKDDSTLILRSANPDYKGDTIIKKKAILVMAIVKGKIRKDQI